MARHSEATQADVSLQLHNGELRVEITDNGKGMDQAMLVHPESLGILSMQERARMLGGTISFTSTTGKGTSVVLHVPMRTEQQAKTITGEGTLL